MCYAVTHEEHPHHRIDKDIERLLDGLCKRSGQSRSEIVRGALRRELSLRRFEEIRRRVLPFAELAAT